MASILTVHTASGQQGFEALDGCGNRSMVWEICYLEEQRGQLTEEYCFAELESTKSLVLVPCIIKAFSRNHQFIVFYKENSKSLCEVGLMLSFLCTQNRGRYPKREYPMDSFWEAVVPN